MIHHPQMPFDDERTVEELQERDDEIGDMKQKFEAEDFLENVLTTNEDLVESQADRRFGSRR